MGFLSLWQRLMQRLYGRVPKSPTKPHPGLVCLPGGKPVSPGKIESPTGLPLEASDSGSDGWPPFVGPLGDLTKDRLVLTNAERALKFGNPGFWWNKGHRRGARWDYSAQWGKRNLRPFELPYVGTRWMHKDAGPYFQEGLRRAQAACPDWRPSAIGALSIRRIRSPGKRPRPWSAHAFGIAIDCSEPDGKFLRYSKVPVEWVRAMRSVGLVHGRGFRGYRDDMHWQIYW